MGILIRNEAVEKKIRALAKRTAQSLTATVERAIDAQLAELGPPKKEGRVHRRRLAKAIAYFDSLPKINEHLTDDDIIGYDENGLPR